MEGYRIERKYNYSKNQSRLIRLQKEWRAGKGIRKWWLALRISTLLKWMSWVVSIKRIGKDIYRGFELAEKGRDKSSFGKF